MVSFLDDSDSLAQIMPYTALATLQFQIQDTARKNLTRLKNSLKNHDRAAVMGSMHEA